MLPKRKSCNVCTCQCSGLVLFSGLTVESHLKEAVMTWYQVIDMHRNIAQVIAEEQHQLDCLDVAADVVSLSASDVNDTIADLQVTAMLS